MKKNTVSGILCHVSTRTEKVNLFSVLARGWSKNANLSFANFVGSVMVGEGFLSYKGDVEVMMNFEASHPEAGPTRVTELEAEIGLSVARRTEDQIFAFLRRVLRVWHKKPHLSFAELIGDAVFGRTFKSYQKDSELMKKFTALA